MKLHCGLDGEKLLNKLNLMLVQEKEKWKPHIYTDFIGKVGGKDRDVIASWLMKVHFKLGFNPETFNLSLSILDRFLLLVRAHPKYLHCIAITCLFLAAKCLEEDEVIPATTDLVVTSNCGCSVAEVLRMERVILTKLQWNLKSLTSLDFVHVLHALLILNQDRLVQPEVAGQQLSSLTHKLFICLCNCEVSLFKYSAIAVALISLELSHHIKNWLAVTIMMQKQTILDNGELIRCREVISRVLAKNGLHKFISCSLNQNLFKVTKPSKRKVQQTGAEDDFYDGIKRLYGEDAAVESKMSCGSQVILEGNIMPTQLTTVSAI